LPRSTTGGDDSGVAGFAGGTARGRAGCRSGFKRIAEQVLPHLDVPRDVPMGPRLVKAAYKNREVSDSAMLEDFTPTDFSGQPDQPPMGSRNQSERGQERDPPATVAVDEGSDIQVPDLSGRRCAT